MKISRSILILLFVSSIIVAFSYALDRTNGNVYKSIMFTVCFLAIKIGIIPGFGFPFVVDSFRNS